MANPIGFTAAFKKKRVKGEDLVKANMPKRDMDPMQTYLKFDSGRVISFNDARHHTLIFGTTGSGKTASVIYLIIYNGMGAGHAMLIGDHKGTMEKAVHKMAKKLGRLDDIVEYGCGQDAVKVNILAYMSEDGMRSFFEQMADRVSPGNDSKIWAQKGAQNAADCVILLRWMAKHNPAFEPTLGRVYEMLNNIFDASRIYTVFLENYYDANDERQRQFVNAVNNNCFHIMKKLERSFRTKEFKPYKEMDDSQYNQQVTWNLQAIKMGLRAFLEAPGIAEHFSVPGAPGIDLETDIIAGKIILLRFDSLSGQTGTFLTRALLSEVIKIVLRYKMEQRNGKFFHIILDEFQEYADFSDNAGSDKQLVALGREFGVEMTAATQSMSSLVCKVGSSAAVESFVGNCNNILSFYNHDAATQELIFRYDHKIKLNKLSPGNLFAVHYDSSTRRHKHGIQKLDKAYKEMCALLESVPDSIHIEHEEEDNPEANIPLSSLLDRLIEDIDAKKRVEQERQKAEQWEAAMKLESTLSHDHEDVDWESKDKNSKSEEDEDAEEEKIEMNDDFFDGYIDEADNSDKNANECSAREKLFAEELSSTFPKLFDINFEYADIPAGWREFTLKTLQMFAATGLSARIETLSNAQGNLVVNLVDGSMFAEYVLNTLLKGASSLCMICGENIDKFEYDTNGVYRDSHIPLCSNCLQKYSFHGLESGKNVSVL